MIVGLTCEEGMCVLSATVCCEKEVRMINFSRASLLFNTIKIAMSLSTYLKISTFHIHAYLLPHTCKD